MRIVIGSEHAGFSLKEKILEYLDNKGCQIDDLSLNPDETSTLDYTHVAARISKKVMEGEYELGILICGTGIGMSIAAGKFPGIRAALCTNEFSARMAREHNDCNVLCLGTWNVGERLAYQIVDTFILSSFQGGRHLPRVNHIYDIEKAVMTKKDFIK